MFRLIDLSKINREQNLKYKKKNTVTVKKNHKKNHGYFSKMSLNSVSPYKLQKKIPGKNSEKSKVAVTVKKNFKKKKTFTDNIF